MMVLGSLLCFFVDGMFVVYVSFEGGEVEEGMCVCVGEMK
jgi:hypothetical protein